MHDGIAQRQESCPIIIDVVFVVAAAGVVLAFAAVVILVVVAALPFARRCREKCIVSLIVYISLRNGSVVLSVLLAIS